MVDRIRSVRVTFRTFGGGVESVNTRDYPAASWGWAGERLAITREHELIAEYAGQHVVMVEGIENEGTDKAPPPLLREKRRTRR